MTVTEHPAASEQAATPPFFMFMDLIVTKTISLPNITLIESDYRTPTTPNYTWVSTTINVTMPGQANASQTHPTGLMIMTELTGSNEPTTPLAKKQYSRQLIT